MLRSEIITPIHSYTFRLVTAAAACGVISAAIALAAPPVIEMPPAPAPGSRELVSMSTLPMPEAEVHLVFRAGGATYMKLADVDPLPAHGTPVLFERGEVDRWQTVSVAEIADVAGWRGRTVTVDGGCEAKVVGFAVVARLTGTPDYAPFEAQAWTAENVLVAGAPVIAAKLDGCDGAVASRAPIIVLAEQRDAALEKRARAKLVASTQAANLEVRTIVARHPRTGVTWVSVHGRNDEGCGGPDINLWGLYRVDGDELVTVEQRELGELHAIDTLLDIDGDGALELLGKPWLGTDTIITRTNGDVVTRLVLPFYGCPC